MQKINVLVPETCRIPHSACILDNGVKIIVCEDCEGTMAAASMCIKVGQNQDPPEVPGLAHLCEHMLFMGTERYPKENEYDDFVARNSGYTNAWTSANCTTYYYSISNDAMTGALDRFVDFFVAPTFNEKSLAREIQAVHSEDEMNHTSDFWRMDELIRHLTVEEHPRHRYGNGNNVTLHEKPKEMGIDLREKLVEFHSEYYTA